MILSRGRGLSNGLECDSKFVRCLILLLWMTSCTVGISRSLWIISLVTCRGTSTMALNIFDWHLCSFCEAVQFLAQVNSNKARNWRNRNNSIATDNVLLLPGKLMFFGTVETLPGRADPNPALTVLCRPQLCAVSGSSGIKLSDPQST